MCDLKIGNPSVSMKVSRNIVNPDKVKTVQAQTLEAVLDRLHRTCFCVVIHDFVWTTESKEIAFFAKVLYILCNLIKDDATDFTAQAVLIPIVFREFMTEANLGKPSTVERSCVEVSGSLRPCSVHGCDSLIVRDVAEHI